MTLEEKYAEYQARKNSNAVGTLSTSTQTTNSLKQKYQNYLIHSYNNAYEQAKPLAEKLTSQSWISQEEIGDAISKWQSVHDYAQKLGDEEALAYAKELAGVLEYANTLKTAYGKYNSAEEYEGAKQEVLKQTEEYEKFLNGVDWNLSYLPTRIKELENLYKSTNGLFGHAFAAKVRSYNQYAPDGVINNRTDIEKAIETQKQKLAEYKRIKQALDTQAKYGTSEYTGTDYAAKIRHNEYMNEVERSTYNRLAAIDEKLGSDRAESYFNVIEEQINERKASAVYENIKDKPFARFVRNVGTGLSQTYEGIKNATWNRDDSYYAPTATSLISSKLREDKETGFGRFMHDATVTTSAMAPAILVSALTSTVSKTAGAATLATVGKNVATGIIGLSAAGNARAEMINLGYSKAQADAYGTLVGASEAALSKLLTTVGGIGGKGIKEAVSKIDNVLFKFAIENAGEAVEEGLQEILEPVFKSLVGGTTEPAEWGDVLYAALMGYVTSVALGGTEFVKPSVSGVVNKVVDLKATRYEVNKTKKFANLIEFTQSLPREAVSRRMATEIANGATAYELYSSLQNTSRAFTKEGDVDRLSEILVKRGVDKNAAQYLAETLVKVSNGAELNVNDQEILSRNTLLASVLLDIQAQTDAQHYDRQSEYFKAYRKNALKEVPKKEAIVTERSAAFSENGAGTVDQAMLNRIAKALGYEFEYVNDLRNKAGESVDAYIEGKKIRFNTNSAQPIRFLIKHELTHAIEKMNNYFVFANEVFEGTLFDDWLDSKGYESLQEYRKQYIEDRIEAKDENFVNETDTDKLNTLAEQEILADFIGDVLFAGDEGINRLLDGLETKTKRTVLEWLRDVFRTLKNKITKADKNLGYELAALERKFTRMLNQIEKSEDANAKDDRSVAEESNVKYALLKIGDIEYVKAEKNIFTKEDGTLASEREVFNSLVGKKLTLSDGVVEVVKRLPEKDMYEELYRRQPKYRKNVKDIKQLNSDVNYNMEELLSNSEPKTLNEQDKENRHAKQGITGFDTRTVKFYDGEKAYDIEFSIATLQDGRKVAYAKKYFGYDEELTKKIQAAEGSRFTNTAFNQQPVSNNRIPQGKSSVNSIYMQNGKKNYITVEKNDEYLTAVKNNDVKTARKLVDEAAKEAGYTVKGYHGSPYSFYKFDRAKIGLTDYGLFGRGFYFSNDSGQSNEYATQGDNNGSVREFYLKMQSPYVINNPQEHAEFDDIYMKYVREAESKGEITKEEFEVCLEKGTQDLRDMGYDSVVYSYGPLEEYIVFESEQAKLADAVTYDDSGDVIPLSKRFNTKESDIRYSISGGERYSYNELVKKPDMKIITVGDSVPDKRTDVVALAKKNAALVGKTNEDGSVSVRVDDIDTEVILSKKGLVHGLDRRLQENAPVTICAGEIIKNSIKINELTPSKKEAEASYVLIGAAQNKDGEFYVVRFIVNQFSNELASMDVLYAINAKKSTAALNAPLVSTPNYRTTISISDLLDYVNKYFPDVLPRSVYEHYGHTERPSGKIGESAKYSISSEERKSIFQQVADHEITPEEAEKLMQKEKPMATLKKIATTTADKLDGTNFKVKKRKQEIDANRKSKFAESLQSANILDREFKQEVARDEFINTYPAAFNRDTLAKAAEQLDNGGAEYVNNWFKKDPKEASLIDEAVGFILLERCRRKGDTGQMVSVAQKLRAFATSAGQRVQIFSILGRMTPEGMLKYAQTELDEALEIYKEIKTAKWLEEHSDEFQLTEADQEFITRRMRQVGEMPSESRAQKIVLAEIAARIQNKLPAQPGQGIKAYQRISMLCNPKTQDRNVVGNAAAAPLFMMSDIFGTGIDALVAKRVANKYGIETQRTKGLSLGKENLQAFKRGAQESYEDWRKKINTRVDFDRFEIGEGKSFNENHKSATLNAVSKTFNWLDRFTSFLLEAGDRPFYEMWFTTSLNAQLKLNNTTEPTSEMLEIATMEALSRTWQDSNGWTKSATAIKNALNTFPLTNLGMIFPNAPNYGLGDIIIKFTKTPANLAKALVDFSPVGLLVNTTRDAINFNNALKKGKYDAKLQHAFVSSLSKGLSGTLAEIVIASLVSMGLISLTGKNDKDKDVRAFENYILGRPEYSIKIGDKYYDYTWAMPLGVMMASVVDFMEAADNKEYTGFKKVYQPIIDAIKASGSVIMEQTFFQSLHDFFANGEDVIENALSSLLNDTSVYVPTIISQVAEITDESRRSTYSSDVVQNAINRIKNRIPVLRQTLAEEKNVLGETSKNANYGNVYRAFFAPGNTYSKSDSEAVDEVYKLYESTGDKAVIPSKAPSTVTKSGETYAYTLQEKSQLQGDMGSISVEIIEELISLKEYQELSDDQKAELLKKVYSYALAKAKSNIVYDYDFLRACYGESLTEQKYNSFTDKQKKMLATELFMSSYSKVKDGEEAEYFLSKVETSTSGENTQKKKEQALKKTEQTK